MLGRRDARGLSAILKRFEMYDQMNYGTILLRKLYFYNSALLFSFLQNTMLFLSQRQLSAAEFSYLLADICLDFEWRRGDSNSDTQKICEEP